MRYLNTTIGNAIKSESAQSELASKLFKELDPHDKTPDPIIALGAIGMFKQIAREICRERCEPEEGDLDQHPLIPNYRRDIQQPTQILLKIQFTFS